MVYLDCGKTLPAEQISLRAYFMQTILMGVFLILHGLVHLLYAGQSRRLFELRPGMQWPDSSWLFSKLLDSRAIRLLASILLSLAALGFVAAGLGVFIQQDWFLPAAVGAAVLSTVIFIVFWNGKVQALDDQGGIGLLINLAILALAWFPLFVGS
jgi:hypothetical protein